MDVKRSCRTRRFFPSEPLWDVFNHWVTHLREKGTRLWPLSQGTRAEEDLLSLVCLQRYVKPPEYTVLRVHVAQKLGLHLLHNSKARDGTTWSPVLSRNMFTCTFSKLFC